LFGKNWDLAVAEIESVLGRLVARDDNLLLVEARADLGRLRRLGLSTLVAEFVGQGSATQLDFDVESLLTSTYSVRVHRRPTSMRISTDNLADLVWRRRGAGRVDLANPAVALHAFVVQDKIWWGRKIIDFESGEFVARAPRQRPFWRSVSIDPRTSRALVNLANPPLRGSVLDPFCGTGSFLVEATLMGFEAFGSDIDRRVVAGAKANLDYEGVSADVRMIDARDLGAWKSSFDALVTDVPYGRSASTHGVDSADLYDAFLRSASSVMVRGGRMVVITRAGTLPQLPPSMRALRQILMPSHESMTRSIDVIERI
jgi:tRNA (guanine10-N2)-dimethyltransferase